MLDKYNHDISINEVRKTIKSIINQMSSILYEIKYTESEHLKDVWQNNNSVIFTDKLQNVDYYFKNIFEQLEELELMWNKYDKIIEEEKNNLILKDI